MSERMKWVSLETIVVCLARDCIEELDADDGSRRSRNHRRSFLYLYRNSMAPEKERTNKSDAKILAPEQLLTTAMCLWGIGGSGAVLKPLIFRLFAHRSLMRQCYDAIAALAANRDAYPSHGVGLSADSGMTIFPVGQAPQTL